MHASNVAAGLNRILYVEDERDIRTIATMALQMVGKFKVEACDSGEAALAAIDAFKPDLLLLDVMMPDMDGPSTLARLRQQPAGADVPAVFMTAKVQAIEIEGLRALGALDVIAKPFDPMTLAERLRAIWQASRP
jgi:two-component system OmpR family response regulator